MSATRGMLGTGGARVWGIACMALGVWLTLLNLGLWLLARCPCHLLALAGVNAALDALRLLMSFAWPLALVALGAWLLVRAAEPGRARAATAGDGRSRHD